MNALFAWLFKFVFAVAAMMFAASLLLVLLAVLVVTSLWSLLQGRKPQVAVMWTRYRDFTRGMTQGGPWAAARGPFGQTRPSEADVVDVQVKEVHAPVQRLPPGD